MNGQEQHHREIALKRINERIDTLAAAVDEEVAEKMSEIRQLVARLIQAEHTELQHELDAGRAGQFDLWKYVSLTHRQIAAFVGLSFAGRLRWLLFGSLPVEFSEGVEFSEPKPPTSDERSISLLRREVLH